MIPIEKLCRGVLPTGDSLCYEVESASRPGQTHRVDLSAWSGHGECSCERWTLHYGPLVRNGHVALSINTACPHIAAAWRYFAIQQAQAVIKFRIAQMNANRADAGKPPINEQSETTPY